MDYLDLGIWSLLIMIIGYMYFKEIKVKPYISNLGIIKLVSFNSKHYDNFFSDVKSVIYDDYDKREGVTAIISHYVIKNKNRLEKYLDNPDVEIHPFRKEYDTFIKDKGISEENILAGFYKPNMYIFNAWFSIMKWCNHNKYVTPSREYVGYIYIY